MDDAHNSRKELVEELTDRRPAATEGLLETVFDATHVLVAYLDAQFNFIRVNRAYAEADEREPSFFHGKNHFDLYPNAENKAIFRRVVETEEPYFATAKPFEYAEHPERGVIYWDWSLVPVKDTKGAVTGLILSITDATERQRAEDALRESEERFRLAAGSISDVVWEWDIIRGDLFWFGDIDSLLGYGSGQFPRTIQAWEDIIHPEDRDWVMRALERHLETREPYVAEHRVLRKDGGIRHWIDKGTALWDDAGKPYKMIGAISDISEQRRAQEERRQLEARMLQTQKLESLGILAGGIAHDFNNLLMAVLGNAELALKALSPVAPARPFVQDAVQAAVRAADLTRQMLAYSGKGRFAVQPVSLTEVVEQMAHLLKISISKKVNLNVRLAPQMPSLQADVAQVQQVVMNLITNASEAIGEQEGVVTISTGAMECDRDYLGRTYLYEGQAEGTYVYLEVSDTGCGMDAETQKRMFDPFFTTKFTGRGLGMAAVLGIVRGHKGAIEVHSEPGRGTTIRVWFPAGQQAAKPAEGVAEAAESYQGSGTILVVDDEESVRVLCARTLQEAGFTVLTASDGQQAVDLFRQHADQIVCVLLDLIMPRMDGREAFEQLRRIRADVPVILSSGYSEQEIDNRFAGARPAAFIEKPYRIANLMAQLRTVLGQSGD